MRFTGFSFRKFSAGGSKIMDVYRLSINDCSARWCATIQDAARAHSTCHGNRAEVRSKTQKITIDAKDGRIFSVTEFCRSLGDPIEHRLKLRW